MLYRPGLRGCGGDDASEPADSSRPGDRTERFERTPLREPSDSGTLKERACEVVRGREVARIAGRPRAALEARANDSTDLSICDWRGGGMRVQMIIDAAPRAQLRYYNQLSEQLQFFNADPERRPYQVKGVGQDSAYGGAGAWWTRSKSQLAAYAKKRIVRVRVVGRGFGDRAKRRPAARLARLCLRRLSAPAS